MSARTVGVFAFLILLVCGAFLYLSRAAYVKSAEPSAKEFILEIKGGKVVSGASLLSAQRGDSVTIKVTADVEDELHLHGYDKSADLEPGVEKTLSFVADITGTFPFELENRKLELGSLQVLP